MWPVLERVGPLQAHRIRHGLDVHAHGLELGNLLGIVFLVDRTCLGLELFGHLNDDGLHVFGQTGHAGLVDGQTVPGDGAEADFGVVVGHFIELEVDPGRREHDPAVVNTGLHGGVSLGQRRLHRHHAGVFQPFEVQAGTGDLAAFEVADLVPLKSGAQVVAVVRNESDQLLVELVLKDLGQLGHPVVDSARELDAGLRVHGTKGQHDLKRIERQVGGFKAKAVTADVDQTGLHAFERVRHLDHGAAVTFNKFNFVRGAGSHALGDFGHKEVLHQVDIGIGRRVTRGDTQPDVFGAGR